MSRPRGPSTRYVNLAASAGALGASGGARAACQGLGDVLDGTRRLAGGREAIVWVHDLARVGWGLADRLEPGHADTVERVLGVPVRDIGPTGWIAVEGAPTVHLAFPAYSGDFAGASSPAVLLDAVEHFRLAVGFAYFISAPKTVHQLIWTMSRPAPTEPEPDLDGYMPTAWAVPANSWGSPGVLEVLETLGARWVRCFDRAGSYLAAWQGATLTDDDWTQLPPGELEPGPESSRPPGYWLIAQEDLPGGVGGFDPFRRHGDLPGPVWLTTPLAQLATEISARPVPYLDAWVTAQKCRALDAPGSRLRDARAALLAGDDEAHRLALTVLKTGYAGATAWLEYGPPPPDPLARPSWRRTLLDRYAANTWRALNQLEPGPFAFGRVDTAVFALSRPEEEPAGLKVGGGLGTWKPKGRPVPIDEALDVFAAGDPNALIRHAEGAT